MLVGRASCLGSVYQYGSAERANKNDTRIGILDSHAVVAGVWSLERLAESLYSRWESIAVYSDYVTWLENLRRTDSWLDE